MGTCLKDKEASLKGAPVGYILDIVIIKMTKMDSNTLNFKKSQVHGKKKGGGAGRKKEKVLFSRRRPFKNCRRNV